MEQYIEIKRDYSDVLLFFRMGDFYELFFDDAYLASDILNITLTKRGKLEGKDIPMCGVPHHSSDRYIEILIKKGINVAICEQTETPEDAKKRGYKSIVNREVVRVITPGTILEDNLIGAKKNNFLMLEQPIRLCNHIHNNLVDHYQTKLSFTICYQRLNYLEAGASMVFAASSAFAGAVVSATSSFFGFLTKICFPRYIPVLKSI